MHKNRLVRFVAIDLLIAGFVFLLAGIVLLRCPDEFGRGLGARLAGWLALPFVGLGLLNALVFLGLGSVLLLLARIDTNVYTARQQALRIRPVQPPAATFAPPAVETPTQAIPAAGVAAVGEVGAPVTAVAVAGTAAAVTALGVAEASRADEPAVEDKAVVVDVETEPAEAVAEVSAEAPEAVAIGRRSQLPLG